MAAERRRDARVRVKVRMELTDEAGRALVLHTTNLSCGGARCTFAARTTTPPEPGTAVQGRLYLPLSEAGRDVDVVLAVAGRVVRAGDAADGEIALAFDGMSENDRAELSAYLFDWLADDCAVASCALECP